MRASLLPLDGGQTIELVKDIMVVGRKEFCDIQIDDPSVSKVHLIIVKTDGVLMFRDMGSTNGTRVNGQRVIRGMLLPNDRLQIAARRYQVQLLPDEPIPPESGPMAAGSGEGEAGVRVFRAEELAQSPPDAERQTAKVADIPYPLDEAEQKMTDIPPSSKTPMKNGELADHQIVD